MMLLLLQSTDQRHWKDSKFEDEQTCFGGGQIQSGFMFEGRDGHA